MSLLGKILAIFTIGAGAVFLYLAAADYSLRQSWSYAVFRQDLALDGLPVDEETRDEDGTPRVVRISDQTLQDMFKSVGGVSSPITLEEKTQVGEVKRIRNKLRGEIEALPGDKEKREKLAAILIPLAPTGGDRDDWAARIRTQPLPDLMGDLDGVFDKALAKNEREEKRQAIAHLLLNLADPKPDATDYQRVMVVVGLKTFATAADSQADKLRNMAQRVSLRLLEDQKVFETEHQRLVGDLRLLHQDLELRKVKLAQYEATRKKHDEQVQARVKDIKELKVKIEETRQATQQSLAKLAVEQQRLFESQRQVSNLASQNQQLELDIQSSEKVKPK